VDSGVAVLSPAANSAATQDVAVSLAAVVVVRDWTAVSIRCAQLSTH
jgi:hypothetical protein